MNEIIIKYLNSLGYTCNKKAQNIIEEADLWYSNEKIRGFHDRQTVQGQHYELQRLNFAKRCCSDDANLCEVIEINASKNSEQNKFINRILSKNRFDSMFREQLELMSALGTVGCYIRLDNALIYDDDTIQGGDIALNYIGAKSIIPLSVVNGDVVECCFAGEELANGKKQYTLVVFELKNGRYIESTHLLNESGNLIEPPFYLQLGEVKPFAVLKTAEVNNIKDMLGYGLPKLINAIPHLKSLELCYNVLFGDLDKGEKLVLVNEALCKFDRTGKPITPSQQAQRTFVMFEREPMKDGSMVHEINPEIRIEEVRDTFETVLSLLSMQFGYGSKRYTFENGQITTATEYVGSKQEQLQELNKQRYACNTYIKEIARAIEWYSNAFHGSSWNLDEEVMVTYDDSYVIDKETELERKRNDSLSFDIPELKVWYLMEAYNLSEDEARKLVEQSANREPREPGED